jgi:hypothetical protein
MYSVIKKGAFAGPDNYKLVEIRPEPLRKNY